MTEGFRSGAESGSIHLTDGSGSGSRRPKNMRIRWIRIRNTASCMFFFCRTRAGWRSVESDAKRWLAGATRSTNTPSTMTDDVMWRHCHRWRHVWRHCYRWRHVWRHCYRWRHVDVIVTDGVMLTSLLQLKSLLQLTSCWRHCILSLSSRRRHSTLGDVIFPSLWLNYKSQWLPRFKSKWNVYDVFDGEVAPCYFLWCRSRA